ncbi:MAG: hypothetical protein A2534_04435 [Candidatus Magasanikbacteria bacterium RIFOXYD2_FULL_39_9]|uniref:Uncharacterized protein n=1 Tax=Candidatus Magasanikbacteria bacterium RIFOXYD1_FULL_40_23 TaxID=1798705 RepID=A0A1F6PBV3_9BACT|nr:MAG: hypothetical protein A2534_04435 [Candidatus Magasanikbacteria bacterium RIFOXYD2_FULL_39_9]OGH93434.1 MAG: hypothetical protein A2563_02395 [Candidatus Magasanikbacteria bacterium RIFOXYD1_FULL_40_23]
MLDAVKIPNSLRSWFFVHFLVDYIFAIPLFLFPQQTLSFFGWGVIDPITTRFVAAALFGIGGVSLAARKSDVGVYKHLLMMKIIWSLSVVVGILFSAFTETVPLFIWVALATFLFFASIWIYYYLFLKK